MEEKNVGKFLNYVKKFLTMSFLSALATVAFSCFSITRADDDSESLSYSGSIPDDEIEQRDATVKNKVIKFTRQDRWHDIIKKAGLSTHDADGNKLPGCTGYWIIKGANGTPLYNEWSDYTKMSPIDYYDRFYDGKIYFSYHEGPDDLYLNDEIITVNLKNLTTDYLHPSNYEYTYAYTVSGNEKVAKDIDPNNLVSTLGISAFDEFKNTVKGTWSWKDPGASIAGYLSSLQLVFTPEDDSYRDLKVTINILNPGREETLSAVTKNDVIQNVSNDGTTSAIKKSSGITWIREESDGTSTYYGFEDPNNVLPEGTRLSVRWDPLDRDFAYDIYSFFSVGSILPEKVWRFNLQALNSKNEEIHDFGGKPLTMRIELGNDWDKDEVVAYYARLENKIKEKWDVSYEDIVIGGKTRTFAVFSPTHFSDYYVTDPTTGEDIYERFISDYTNKMLQWLKENPNATPEEKQAQEEKITTELLGELSDGQKKALFEYNDSLNSKKSSDTAEQSSTKAETVTESNTTTATIPSTSTPSSYSSKSSAGTQTGADGYSQLLSFLSIGSLAGIGSCLKKKKD